MIGNSDQYIVVFGDLIVVAGVGDIYCGVIVLD